MKHPLVALLISLVANTVAAQLNDATTHNVWALDKGNAANPTPIIRVYSPSGAELTTIAVPGSGPARAMAFDRNGNAYVCSGNLVYQLDPAGAQTGVTFAPPSGAATAMDVAESPQGEIIVAWGSNATNSAITTYDTTGMQVSNFTDPGLNHPRRITPRLEPTSTIVYIANRGGDEIAAFDTGGNPAGLFQIVDLTGQNVGPVGLCYDNANDDLWVVGDYGQSQEIGCIDLSSNTYSTAINYPPSGASGMTSPAGVSYDRFRRLYVAGRDKNGGTPGIYVFDARSPSVAPTLLAQWPRTGATPNSIIDVQPQPIDVTLCTPEEFTNNGPTYIVEMGANNRVTFSSPSTPGAPFAAAFSGRWTDSACGATFVQGTIEIPILAPDVRGIPLISDNYFWGSVAVVTPGPSPVVPPMGFGNNLQPIGIGITGFLGDLDANGFEDGFIDLTNFIDPANQFGLDGLELSLTFVTFDVSEPSLFGVIAQPICMLLRNPAVVAVNPPTVCQ